MKNIITILLLTFFIISCNNSPDIRPLASGPGIEKTIQRAKIGVISANDSISTLLGLSLSENHNYNKLKIDSLTLPSAKYFTILIEYPNPVNNKFGIYNDSLKTLLLDKSLYGELSEEIINLNGTKYIKVNEGFTVKNNLELSRLSLYKIKNDKAGLVFRTFTRLKEPDAEYTQVINSYSDAQITTKINGNNQDLGGNGDTFNFESSSGSYVSKQNLFTDFVKREIRNLSHDQGSFSQ